MLRQNVGDCILPSIGTDSLRVMERRFFGKGDTFATITVDNLLSYIVNGYNEFHTDSALDSQRYRYDNVILKIEWKPAVKDVKTKKDLPAS